MNKLRQIQLSVLAGLCLATGPAFGAMTFNFSCQSSDGLMKVTGSLQGEQVGDDKTGYIKNVANVSVFFNQIPMSGSIIYTARYDLPPPYSSGAYVIGPFVSFDVSQNNFCFSNGEIVNHNPYTQYFEILDVSSLNRPIATAGTAVNGEMKVILNENPSNARWSLTAAVPEPSTYIAGLLLCLPLAVSGIRCLRKTPLKVET